MFNKNFIVICISSTIAAFPPVAVVLLGGIITSQIMMKDSLATVPMTLMIIGIAISAPIASRFMSIWGRQKGFLFSSLLSCLALIICSIAIYLENFLIFASGNFLIGSSQAFIHQYRFAASESVDKEFIPRSISIILLLGVVSALLSSNFAEYFKDFFPSNLFLGSYIFLSFTAIIPFFVILFYNETKTSDNQSKFEIETIFKLLKNIKIIQSIVSAGLGYFTMAIIMTATPLHMHLVNKFTLFETSIVIQLHVIGMFLPSLFSGDLIKRFGNTNIIFAGVVILFLSILTNTFFDFYYSYMLGLILLGIGWNFLFVSGSSLLVVSYEEKDKFTAQGLNDFIVFSTQGIGSLSAGFLLYFSNWTVINLLCVPLLIIVLVVSLFASKHN